MAWSTTELIEQFRLTIPAMPADVVSDAELASDIDVYSAYVSEKRFGKLYPKALSYFIAHMRTLNDMIAGAVASGSNAGDPVLNAGALISEREGDLARGYSSGGSGSSSGSSSDSDEVLKKTIYGKLFLQLRAMVICSATVRVGGHCGTGCGQRL